MTPSPERLIEAIRRYSAELADVCEKAPSDAPIPACDGWTIRELLAHVTEVQRFWAWIISHRPADPDGYSAADTTADTVPDTTNDEVDHAERIDVLRQASSDLLRALGGAEPHEEAWSWSEDHTVGFTIRRQAHEVLVHLADAFAATNTDLTSVDPDLASDGIAELVDVMLTGVPDWATFARTDGVIEVRTTDAPLVRTLAFGKMTGVSPTTGTSYDLVALEASDQSPDGVVRGSSLDLLLWLWGRRSDDVVNVSGDAELVIGLRALVEEATQ